MSQKYLQELKVVDPAYRECTTDNIDKDWTQIPEKCSRCGADLKVKYGWRVNGHDTRTGQANSYEARVVCSKASIWRPFSIHDDKLLIYTPPSFNMLINRNRAQRRKDPVAHLTVLTRAY